MKNLKCSCITLRMLIPKLISFSVSKVNTTDFTGKTNQFSKIQVTENQFAIYPVYLISNSIKVSLLNHVCRIYRITVNLPLFPIPCHLHQSGSLHQQRSSLCSSSFQPQEQRAGIEINWTFFKMLLSCQFSLGRNP